MERRTVDPRWRFTMRAIPGNCLERNFVDPIKSNFSRIQRGRVNAKHGASSCLEMGLVFARGGSHQPRSERRAMRGMWRTGCPGYWYLSASIFVKFNVMKQLLTR